MATPVLPRVDLTPPGINGFASTTSGSTLMIEKSTVGTGEAGLRDMECGPESESGSKCGKVTVQQW